MPDVFNASNPPSANSTDQPSTQSSSIEPPPVEPVLPTGPSAPQDASSFSFQNQGASTDGSIPQPTVPFETISLQKVEEVENAPVKPTAADYNTGDIKLDVLRDAEKPVTAQAAEPQPSSFLERYKEEAPPVEKKSLDEVFSPSESLPKEEKKEAVPTQEAGYKMPDLPQSSILSKILPIALFLLVVGLAIFAAMKFLPQFTGAKKVELTWWGLWEDEKNVQVVINNYTREKPNVTIKYVKENPREYRTRLQSVIARDAGPDIFRFHNTWLPMLKTELAAMPEKLKTEINYTNTFYPVTYYDLIRDNKIYGIPLMFDGLAMYYNSDIFQNAGLSVPTNWDEVLNAAKKLTVRDGENLKVAGIAMGNTNVEHWSDILGIMLLQNGADPSLPTDVCAREAVDYFINFTSGDQKVWDDTLGNSVLAFANGKAAMMVAPSWEAFELKKINANLNFKITAFPQIPGGKRFWASYWVEGVNSKSKNQSVAWDFLMFLSKKETLQLLYTDAAKSSTDRLFGEIYPRQDMVDLVKNDPLVAPYLAGAKESKSWYLASRTFDQGINDRMIKYYEDLVNKLNRKEESTDEALKTVSLGVAQVLKDYGLTQPASNPNCTAKDPTITN
jgi:multiple sugar transport system substrate-binding protein